MFALCYNINSRSYFKIKGDKMGKLLTAIMVIFFAGFISGCANYANLEDIEMGMTIQEISTRTDGCYYSGQEYNQTEYRCKFKVPYGSGLEKRTVKPYILEFKNNRLQTITLDEQALNRQSARYYYRIGYGYGGYHYGVHRH